MLYGLRTWWVGAIGAPVLFLHVRGGTLLLGGGLSLLVVAITLAVALARVSRWPAAQLLAGRPGDSAASARGPALARRTMATALAGAGVATAAALFAEERAAPALAFGAGALALAAGFAALADRWGDRRSWSRRRALALRGPAWLAAGARNGARNRGRSLLAAALVACATFVLTVIAVHRGEGEIDPLDRASGAGGFALVAESDVAIVGDLNRSDSREELGLGEASALAGTNVVPFRLLPGEDASCLNLYQPRRPRVLGVPPEMIDRGGFSFQALSKPVAEPWGLLDEDLGDGRPSRLRGCQLGDLDSQARPGRRRRARRRARPAAASAPGGPAGAEPLPERAADLGARLRAPLPEPRRRLVLPRRSAAWRRGSAYARPLERGLERFGFDATPTAERLRAFAAVETAYLSTFQALGGLGLLLGTVGLGVVLLRNALERRRELAMMSALGFRRSQLAGLVLAENLVLLVAGLALGVASAAVATVPHLAAQASRDTLAAAAAHPRRRARRRLPRQPRRRRRNGPRAARAGAQGGVAERCYRRADGFVVGAGGLRAEAWGG